MDPSASLQASFWSSIVLQTLGSVDMPGGGPRKMPAPRAYLAVIITWGGLQLLADTGRERAASVVGWVFVLSALVLGPFGKRLVNLLDLTAAQVSNQPQQGTP